MIGIGLTRHFDVADAMVTGDPPAKISEFQNDIRGASHTSKSVDSDHESV